MASLDMECCIWAHHDRLLESHSVKNTHWRKQSGEDMSMSDLLQYVGANATSHDVHWPLSLALRPIHLKSFRKKGRRRLCSAVLSARPPGATRSGGRQPPALTAAAAVAAAAAGTTTSGGSGIHGPGRRGPGVGEQLTRSLWPPVRLLGTRDVAAPAALNIVTVTARLQRLPENEPSVRTCVRETESACWPHAQATDQRA